MSQIIRNMTRDYFDLKSELSIRTSLDIQQIYLSIESFTSNLDLNIYCI